MYYQYKEHWTKNKFLSVDEINLGWFRLSDLEKSLSH